MSKSCLQILKDARQFLSEHEWVGGPSCPFSEAARPSLGTGGFVDCKGRDPNAKMFTPFGAILAVSAKDDDFVTAQAWLKMHANQKYGFRSIHELNTAPGMTKEQILENFDEVIKKTEAHEARYGKQ